MDVEKVLFSVGIPSDSVELIPTFQNKVYKVTGEKNYFIKIFTDEPYLAGKLASLYPLLKERGVPVPEVIHSDLTIASPWIILSEVLGELLGDIRNKLSQEQLATVYQDLGDTLGKVHSITFDQFGETIDGKTAIRSHEYGVGPVRTWKEMHRAIIAQRLSYFEGTTLAELISPLKEYFSRNESLIDYAIVPRLLHIDLNQKNVFVKDGRISGFIDFDGSFVGHNEEELMRTASANFSDEADLRDAFFAGYMRRVQLDEGYEDRRPYYFLSRLLVHGECLILFGETYKKDFAAEMLRIKKEIKNVLDGNKPHYEANKA